MTTTEDIWGDTWRVVEERPTKHRFVLVLGRVYPVPRVRGGGGGTRVIVTRQLASYLEDYRLRVSEIDLPCGSTTIKRLRKLLGHNWYSDSLDWWLDRIEDLGTLTIEEFAEQHDVSSGAVSVNRQALLGSLQRPFGWWRDPDVANLVLSPLPLAVIGDRLGIPAGSAGRLRAILRR